MKTKVFFLAMVFVFPLFLCAGNSIGKSLKDEKPTDTLYLKGVDSDHKYNEDWQLTMVPPEEYICTGDSILSYNLTTEEIVFTDSIKNILANNYPMLNIYLNDQLLLENIVQIRPSMSIYPTNLLLFSDEYGTHIFQLVNLRLILLADTTNMDEWNKKLFKNAEKQIAGWDIFIKYLSDAGKIVDNTAISPPSTTSKLNAISIYLNPTTGELKIKNEELKIQQVTIFNMFGVTVLKTRQATFDVSYLPAGIYFVQITTEKGIVTKKVVKK